MKDDGILLAAVFVGFICGIAVSYAITIVLLAANGIL